MNGESMLKVLLKVETSGTEIMNAVSDIKTVVAVLSYFLSRMMLMKKVVANERTSAVLNNKNGLKTKNINPVIAKESFLLM